MGVSISTARYLAPASFIFDFAAQQYGMLSSPNMKDIHDANLSFFSPQPYFIAGFFFPQQLFQLTWMYRLWKLDSKNPKDKKALDQIVKYAPYYVLGNVCIGLWMFAWNSNRLALANVFVTVNTTTQLWYMFSQLEPMDTSSLDSILTHIISKTFTGIGVLDLLHNTSVAFFKDQLPSTTVKVLTGLGFAGLSACSDWIFGGCLVYDLVGLSVGQSQIGNSSWSQLLGGFALGSAAIVAFKNFIRPPYASSKASYLPTNQDDV